MHHALADFEDRQHNVHAVGHGSFCKHKSQEKADGLFGTLQFRQVHRGLHDAHYKEQHNQSQSNCYEGIVNSFDDAPDRAALEGLRRLGDQLPDLRHFLVPCGQGVAQIVHDPVSAWLHGFHLPSGRQMRSAAPLFIITW